MNQVRLKAQNTHHVNKNHWGTRIVIALFIFAGVLGVFVFKKYVTAEQYVVASMTSIKQEGPSLTIEGCAQKTMNWYLGCQVMKQICDDTVTRMMKVCLLNGEKFNQCKVYGDAIFGYNFGAVQCQPYLKHRDNKKVCADIWQTIADYCKVSSKK